MSMLFKFKRWLTLDEAAEHLSTVLNEKVTVQDILRLALDCHLVLSINIVNGIRGSKGKRIPMAETPFRVMPSIRQLENGGTVPLVEGFPGDDDLKGQREWLFTNNERLKSGDLIAFPEGTTFTTEFSYHFEKKIASITGLWDLPMLGSERLDVEHALQQLIGGPEVTGTYLDGTFLVSLDRKTYVHLMEHYSENKYMKDGNDKEKYPWGEYQSYFPAGGLPNDEQLVVRTDAIADFLRSLQGTESTRDKTLSTRERNNLLRLIAGLAKEAGIDLREGKGGAAAIEAAVIGLGFDSPKERTIRDILKQVRDVL